MWNLTWTSGGPTCSRMCTQLYLQSSHMYMHVCRAACTYVLDHCLCSPVPLSPIPHPGRQAAKVGDHWGSTSLSRLVRNLGPKKSLYNFISCTSYPSSPQPLWLGQLGGGEEGNQAVALCNRATGNTRTHAAQLV